MKEEKVRIKVRLTEEEKEKLERNSALCGLTQSEYVRQLCRGIHPKPKPPAVFWQLVSCPFSCFVLRRRQWRVR